MGLKRHKLRLPALMGNIIDEAERAFFQGHLPIGDPSEDLMGRGLQDSMAAEVHLVVRTHGPAVPGQVDEMINTFNGGCSDTFPNEPCQDLQFAVFAPVDGS